MRRKRPEEKTETAKAATKKLKKVSKADKARERAEKRRLANLQKEVPPWNEISSAEDVNRAALVLSDAFFGGTTQNQLFKELLGSDGLSLGNLGGGGRGRSEGMYRRHLIEVASLLAQLLLLLRPQQTGKGGAHRGAAVSPTSTPSGRAC